MATLDKIHKALQEIKETTKTDTETAKQLIYALFLDLIQEDAGLFVIYADDKPYASPVQNGSPMLFLAAFTDYELALSMAMPMGGKTKKLDSIDFLRLAKWAFLRGVDGIQLNPGDSWCVIAIPDLIRIFTNCILQDESEFSQSYVDCVRLITAVRHNSVHKLVCAVSNGYPAACINGQEKSYVFSEDAVVMPNNSTDLVPVNLQTLFYFRNIVSVSLFDKSFDIDVRDLQAALKVCGIQKEDSTYIPASLFYDEPIALDGADDGFKAITDISLTFRENDYGKGLAQDAIPTALVPVPEEEDEPEPETKFERFKRKAAEKRRAIRERVAGFVGIFAKGAKDKPTNDAKLGDKTSDAKEEPSKKPESKKKDSKINAKMLVPCAVGVLAICIAAGALHRSAISKAQFRERVTAGEYTTAYELYEKHSFGKKEDEFVASQIQAVLNEYANGKRSASELNAALQGLAQFPGQKSHIEAAYQQAAKLETSKNAYIRGCDTSDISERFTFWAQVIPDDILNYENVQRQTASHREDWLGALVKDVESYAYVDREAAMNALETAKVFYADDAAVAKWDGVFNDEAARAPKTQYPIQVITVNTQHTNGDALSLYLKWRNTSGETIDSIYFYFKFLDENGNRVVCKRRGETFDIYRGEETADAPYEPGYWVTSDTWGWVNVWKGSGSHVAKTVITGVEIHYANGAVENYVTPTDLSGLGIF